ncbi:MAG: alpha/beta hydrolase [Clostridiales bacterium]|nr:alpha/beta hydrolase [Clostridiales bacterium]
MSLVYKAAEKCCFILNKLPGGGPKGDMSDLISGNDDIRLPGCMHSGLDIREISFEGFTVHRIHAGNPKCSSKKAVLFLPGGGGMARAIKVHYDTAKSLAIRTGAEIVIAHYPLAPKHNVRYALEWLEKLYYCILLKEYEAEDIVFMGDSAGANLALSLAYRLTDKPGRLMIISPACGLENGRNRDIRLEMEPKDPILTVAMNDLIAEHWCRNVPLDSPDISPEYIGYNGFPPMLMFYGTHELFYPHVINYIEKLKGSGISLTAVEKPMCHDWALVKYFPEGREALNRMCEWIRK